jgi:acyl-CoA dehydrogenase family protein 9
MAIEESFMKALFHGVIAEDMVLPWPEIGKDEREHTALLLEGLRSFAAHAIDPVCIDREGMIPEEVLQGLRERGCFGLNIPQEYGGRGLSASATTRVIQELAGIDSSVAVTLATHLTLGVTGLLLFGTEAQKRAYLPRMATGDLLGAFALTEPGTGSDAGAIQTRADRAPDGDGYVLEGKKSWVTNGGLAGLYTVFARTTARDGVSKPRITAFLVERGDGVRLGDEPRRLGLRGASIPDLVFDALRVPSTRVLGEVGRGFKVAMEVLNVGRMALAGACLGACRRLIALSVQRCSERSAFGRPIGEFGMVRDKVARMMAEAFALESMTYLTTGLRDARVPDFSLESAICKVFGSEVLWRTAHEALQIAASAGYVEGHPTERLLRDARVNLIFEGTSEILRAFIALSGMQGPGRSLDEVSRAMREPIKGFGLLSDFVLRKARSALGRERLNRAHPSLRREIVLFEEHTMMLSKSVDKVLRRHGKDIAEMQYTQRRMADMAIDLYALAACLSRTTRAIERKGEEGARREVEFTAAFANAAEKRLQANVTAFDANDDELLKGIAGQVYQDGAYPFDIV